LYENATSVVPSLIILSDPESFKKQTGADVSDGILVNGRKMLSAFSRHYLSPFPSRVKNRVILIDHTPDPDTRIVASLLHSSSSNSYEECLYSAKKMRNPGRELFLKHVLKDLSEHDSLFREFETVSFLFEIVLSSSAYAQIKRHRMMTLLRQR